MINKRVVTVLLLNTLLVSTCFAAEVNLGGILENMRRSLGGILTLVFSLSVVASVAFAVLSAFKFKQFKDNPTQITIGQPFALLMLAAAMMWMPFIIRVIGTTITGGGEPNASLSGQGAKGFGKFDRGQGQ